MKNSKVILPVIILLCVSLSCAFLKDKFTKGGKPATEFIAIAKLPPFDPKAPLASPGAFIVRQLAKIDPSVAALADQVEASERGVMQKIIAANPSQSDTGVRKEKTSSQSSTQGTSAIPLAFANPAVSMLQAGQPALPGVHDGAFVGMITGEFKSMLAGVKAGDFHKRDSKTELDKETGGTTTMNVELDVGEDGSTAFGMGINTESMKNGVKVATEAQAKIDGQDCPNAEGQVPITVKVHLSGQSGGSTYAQDVTVFIRIVVDDNADIIETTMDVNQGTRRGKIGQEVYIETAQTIRYGNDSSKATTVSDRLIQHTDNATQDDLTEISNSGYSVAYGAAIGALRVAENTWQNGGCIKIQAESPGTVAVSSTTSIPVKVLHKKDDSEIAAKLEAVLSGESSVEPKLIPRTAGTLTYVAPAETGKSATIKLTATSKRGKATLDLAANTGGASYRIVGGLDDWQTDTAVCDIMKPFTLTGAGFTMQFSGGLSGTYSYTGPFNANGTGTYTISLPDGVGKPGTMTGGGAGTITGDKVYTGKGTEHYTLTPIPPCS